MTTTDKTKAKRMKQGSAEWHAERSKGIGGSDMAAVMGLNPWKTPYEVWLEKTGRVKPWEGNEKTRIGNAIEDFCAAQYTAYTGSKVRKVNGFRRCDTVPVIGGSIDRMILGKDGEKPGILEMKNVSTESWNGTFKNGIPDYYYIQMQVYMLVFKANYAHLWVFVGGERFEKFEVLRSNEVIGKIIEAANNFWFEYVLRDTPPPVTAKSDLAVKYPTEKVAADFVKADETITELVNDLAYCKSAIKEFEAKKEDLELRIMDYIGEKEELRDEAGEKVLATWKVTYRNSLDQKAFKAEEPDTYNRFVKATESRTFLLKVKQ